MSFLDFKKEILELTESYCSEGKISQKDALSMTELVVEKFSLRVDILKENGVIGLSPVFDDSCVVDIHDFYYLNDYDLVVNALSKFLEKQERYNFSRKQSFVDLLKQRLIDAGFPNLAEVVSLIGIDDNEKCIEFCFIEKASDGFPIHKGYFCWDYHKPENHTLLIRKSTQKIEFDVILPELFEGASSSLITSLTYQIQKTFESSGWSDEEFCNLVVDIHKEAENVRLEVRGD